MCGSSRPLLTPLEPLPASAAAAPGASRHVSTSPPAPAADPLVAASGLAVPATPAGYSVEVFRKYDWADSRHTPLCVVNPRQGL